MEILPQILGAAPSGAAIVVVVLFLRHLKEMAILRKDESAKVAEALDRVSQALASQDALMVRLCDRMESLEHEVAKREAI